MKQLKKKQQVQPLASRNPCLSNKAYLKPSLFQFPSVMNKTTTFADNVIKCQMAYTPEAQARAPLQLRVVLFLNQVTQGPQRFSAKLAPKESFIKQKGGTVISKQQFTSKQTKNEPVIIKITTTKNNHSQIIHQSEEQSEYQLSELETFDELVQQIKERILNQNPNIIQISHDLCQLEAIDLKGLPFIPQLLKHIIISSVQQQVHIPQILGVLLSIVEEILMRDDLDVSLLEMIKVYLQKGYETCLSMIVIFLKRCGQMIYYVRNDKLKTFSELLVTLWSKFDGQYVDDLAINILLRHKQLRLLIKQQNLNQIQSKSITTQLERFKIIY